MAKVIYLDDLRKELGMASPDLLTRDLGRKAFRRLVEEIRAIPESEVLNLSAKGILLIDGSFFDEAILTLFLNLTQGKYGNRFLVMTDISPDVLFNLEAAVARREGGIWIPARDQHGKWKVVGALEQNLLDTFVRLETKGELTARELADELKIGINNASNRLRRLFEARLARRMEETSESGLYHRYSAVG